MTRSSSAFRTRYTLALLIVTLILFVRPVPGVHAASITVNASCSLDDAITAANTDRATGSCPAGSGADTITLTGNIRRVGSNQGLNVTSDITILGNAFSIVGRKGLFGDGPAGTSAFQSQRYGQADH